MPSRCRREVDAALPKASSAPEQVRAEQLLVEEARRELQRGSDLEGFVGVGGQCRVAPPRPLGTSSSGATRPAQREPPVSERADLWQAGHVCMADAEWGVRRRARGAAQRRAGKLRGVVLVAGLVGALSGAAPVRAAELSARGPEQCPGAAELAFRVERAVGMPLAQSGPLRFSIVFEPPTAPARRYTARVEVHGNEPLAASAQRVLSAHDCGRLGDAVSVAIALAIRSSQVQTPAASSEPEPASPVEATGGGRAPGSARGPAAVDTPVADELSGSSDEAEEGAAFAPVLSLAVVADSGSLPAPGLGVGLGVELRGQRFALRANGTLLFDQHVAIEERSGAPGADMSLVLGGLSACTAPIGNFRASFATAVCAGWELGRLGAVGTGVQTALRGNQLWSAPRVDAGLSWAVPASAFRFNLILTAAAPLKRDDFFLRELGRVYRPPGAVGRLALGVDISFE
jgi:hypothetical protein